MDDMDGNIDFTKRITQYELFDRARHNELAKLAYEYEQAKSVLKTLRDDLEDERATRRNWRQRAEIAESLTSRNQFALVLIDGDGYVFNKSFLENAMTSGGAEAAHALQTDVLQYLHNSDMLNGHDMEVMVIVYLNKNGLAKALSDADIIRNTTELDHFLWLFTQSKSLFQVVDIGYGKERADSKLRDTYKFYAYNAQCKHIFLACAHDNGYVAELDKYRHDEVAASKTIIVKHETMARQYQSLPFPIARLPTLFDTAPSPSQFSRRPDISQAPTRPSRVATSNNTSSMASTDSLPTSAAPSTWSTVTAGSVPLPIRTQSTSSVTTPPTSTTRETINQPTASKPPADPTKSIPINRLGARLDRHINPPSNGELDKFERRIAENGKLCNAHHLSQVGCGNYNCYFDHEPIDATMKNTLRYKARAITCPAGGKCRKGDCYYGHVCPWGEKCMNSKCKFEALGGHGEDGTGEIVKFVPAM